MLVKPCIFGDEVLVVIYQINMFGGSMVQSCVPTPLKANTELQKENHRPIIFAPVGTAFRRDSGKASNYHCMSHFVQLMTCLDVHNKMVCLFIGTQKIAWCKRKVKNMEKKHIISRSLNLYDCTYFSLGWHCLRNVVALIAQRGPAVEKYCWFGRTWPSLEVSGSSSWQRVPIWSLVNPPFRSNFQEFLEEFFLSKKMNQNDGRNCRNFHLSCMFSLVQLGPLWEDSSWGWIP